MFLTALNIIIKGVLRLVLLYALVLLHLRNKTAVQGKSQSYSAEIVRHAYNHTESAMHFSLLKF
nr:MAG TPA: hypothetical protein [Bacteriophage sp.]